jgi:hypothetical protein
MTKADKPVRRETYSTVRERGASRPIILEIHATFITIRLKGTRHHYTVTHDQLYSLGAKNAAAARREEMAKAKKERAMR